MDSISSVGIDATWALTARLFYLGRREVGAPGRAIDYVDVATKRVHATKVGYPRYPNQKVYVQI